jgi:type I restriction enzyme S subunit
MQEKLVSLGTISTRIDYGLTASATELDTGNKFLRITDISEGRVNWTDVPYCQCSQRDAKKYELQRGDIVFARTGSVGNSCLVREVPKGAVFASYLIRIRPNKQLVDPVYLSYFFHTPDYWQQIMGAAVGAIHLGLNATKLKQLRIPMLPLPEQERIADILVKVDRLRRLRRTARDLSDTYLQSVFLEMFGDPVSNPRGWETDLLGNLGGGQNAIVDGPFGASVNTKVDYVRDGEIPVIRTKNVRPFEFVEDDLKFIRREKFETIKRSRVVPGDIILTKVGTVGNVCIFPDHFEEAVLSTTGSCKITPDTHKIDRVFLAHHLHVMRTHMNQVASEGVQAFLNMKTIKAFQITLPPASLQQEFAHIVHRFERLRAQQREAERQAEHLFQTLLHRAFRGEL